MHMSHTADTLSFESRQLSAAARTSAVHGRTPDLNFLQQCVYIIAQHAHKCQNKGTE